MNAPLGLKPPGFKAVPVRQGVNAAYRLRPFGFEGARSILKATLGCNVPRYRGACRSTTCAGHGRADRLQHLAGGGSHPGCDLMRGERLELIAEHLDRDREPRLLGKERPKQA